MADILDPAAGPYVLTSNTGPSAAAYTPNTTADYTGDGDVDDYFLSRTDPVAFDEATGFMDSGAAAPQVITFSVLPISMDANGNARCYVGSVVDSGVAGAKNANAGYYIEHGGPNGGGDVGVKFGNISDGSKVTFGNDLVAGQQYWYTVTYDPAADTLTLDIYTDSGRTALLESSGALDMSVGPDSAAGGHPCFQALDATARGKGAAPYQLKISQVALNSVPPGPPTEIRVKMNIDASTVHPNGTTVLCYDAANNLELTGNVGSITGADTGNPAIVAPAAGEAVFTFPNADLAQRWIAIDPAVNVNGAQSNLKTPVQLV